MNHNKANQWIKSYCTSLPLSRHISLSRLFREAAIQQNKLPYAGSSNCLISSYGKSYYDDTDRELALELYTVYLGMHVDSEEDANVVLMENPLKIAHACINESLESRFKQLK